MIFYQSRMDFSSPFCEKDIEKSLRKKTEKWFLRKKSEKAGFSWPWGIW